MSPAIELLRATALVGALLTAIACSPAPEAANRPASQPGEWAQWRGPERDGVVRNVHPRPSWKDGEPREIWRRPLGEGYSAVTVADGRALTLLTDGERELLIALDASDGNELWRLELGPYYASSQGGGPRSTAAVAAGHVYALGARGGLHAARVSDGQRLWQMQMVGPPAHGFASSPLIEGDLLVVGGRVAGDTSVLAVDRHSGEVAWAAVPGDVGYASPIAVEIAGQRQIIAFSGDAVFGLVPATGEVLWHLSWPTQFRVNAADPVLIPPDRLFISSGYDQGAALLQLQASGDPEVLWASRVMKNHFSSSVLHGDTLYGFDGRTLRAVAIESGVAKWRHRGFGKGSLILADDHLLVLSDDGLLALVEAKPEEYREKGRVQALEGRTWTAPTLAGSWLYLRSLDEIVCLELPLIG